jgi:hypothetical protein
VGLVTGIVALTAVLAGIVGLVAGYFAGRADLHAEARADVAARRAAAARHGVTDDADIDLDGPAEPDPHTDTRRDDTEPAWLTAAVDAATRTGRSPRHAARGEVAG